MIRLILPELVLSLGIAVLLTLTLFSEKQTRFLSQKTALLFIAGVFFSCIVSLPQTGSLFWNTYKIDLLSQSFKCLLSLATFFVILFSPNPAPIPREKRTEYFVFLLSATLGMIMLSSAVELLTFYVALELSAYSLYLLVPMKDYKWNAEAGIKYLLFGAAASGLLLYGLSILLGLTQTPYLSEISTRVPSLVSNPAFLLAVFFIFGSIFFKLSVFPFHFWAPDTYEAASTMITTFIATASKVTAVVILLRLFWHLGVAAALVPILSILAFLSMTVGNTAALLQRDVKRLLAYSSVAQAGYILVGLLTGTLDAYSAVFFYAVAYVFMNLGVFIVTLRVGEAHNIDNPNFSHFNGLAERSPLLALLLLISLLSLAGIPPLMGFTGKWFIFSAAMKQGHWFLVLSGVINSVISLFYYLTLVKHAYLFKPESPDQLKLDLKLKVVCLGLSLILLIFGLLPNQLLQTAEAAFAVSL